MTTYRDPIGGTLVEWTRLTAVRTVLSVPGTRIRGVIPCDAYGPLYGFIFYRSSSRSVKVECPVHFALATYNMAVVREPFAGAIHIASCPEKIYHV
jgi:hypothetical protein